MVVYLGKATPASGQGGGGSGDAVWGSITGTLANQTDLQNALNDKQDVIDVNNKLSTDYINGLATVATTGAYADLSGTPTIPTVNNATLTITQNNTSVGTFTANASSDVTLNLTDTTYSAFTGADGSSAGSTGLVPAPTASDNTKFLKGDGTWGTPSTNVDYDNSTINENASNQLQAVGIVNQNTAVGAISPLKLWNGTEAEWNTGGISQTWYNWMIFFWHTEEYDNYPDLNGITYGDGKFIAVGLDSTILSSTDGSTWTQEADGDTTGVWDELKTVAYGNNKFIAIGNSGDMSSDNYGGTILSSIDGSTWTIVTNFSDYNIYDMIYANGKFVAVSDIGTIIYSTDGSTWQTVSSITGGTSLNGITYGDGKFIAVGHGIYSSTDGVTWTQETSDSLNAVTYGNGKYIGVTNKKILSSTDGSTWQVEVNSMALEYSNLKSVAYGDGIFVALGSSKSIWSIDGSEWKNLNGVLNFVSYENNKFFAVGNSGFITSSTIYSVYTDTATPTTASTVYSAPDTASALTITSVNSSYITLSDNRIYYYNENNNQFVNQSVGESYPNYLCFINGVGIKIGTTSIITVDQTYNASSANAQSGVAVAEAIAAI